MAEKRLSQFTSFALHNAAVIGITMSTTLIFAFATLYLREEISVSNFLVGVAASLSHITSVFLSPLAGTLSDNAQTPWGRRRPFIIVGACLAAVFIAMMPSIHSYWLFLFVLSMFFVFSIAYQIPFYALIPEVAPEGKRGAYSTFTGLLRLAGFGLAMGLGGWLWAKSPAWPFYLTAIVIVITAAITVFTIREDGGGSLPEQDNINIFRKFRPYLKDLLGHQQIFLFYTAQFFWWLGLGALVPFATIILKELYGIQVSELMKTTPLVVTAGVVMIGTVVGAGILGDRWGHRRVITAGLLMLTTGCVIAFLVRAMPLVYVAAFFIIVGLAPLLNEPYAMLAELVPKGREGEFYGLDTISITLSQVPAALIGGAVIDLTGHTGIYLFVAGNALIAILFMWMKPRS